MYYPGGYCRASTKGVLFVSLYGRFIPFDANSLVAKLSFRFRFNTGQKGAFDMGRYFTNPR